VTVLGVQPAVIEAGMELSAAVAAALPRLCRAVHDLVRRKTGVPSMVVRSL